MIRKSEKKGRVKGQESMKSKDYFDDYFEQLVSWGYEKTLRGLTKSGSNFGP